MSNVFTLSGSNGKNIGDAQPVAGSVAGSPFTSAVGSVSTPILRGLAMILSAGNPIHVRFDKVGTAAVAADFQIPADTLLMIPCDGHIMSFVQQTAAALVYVAIAREVEV